MATINGTANVDTVTGTGLADLIDGLGGNDVIAGGGGADTIRGGAGDDVVRGDSSPGVRLLSSGATGVQANGGGVTGNNVVAVSPDGTKIIFASNADNLVPGDTNGANDLFLKDLTTGAVTRISTDATGGQTTGSPQVPVFSPDGTKVAFTTNTAYPGDTNGQFDVYIKDLVTGTVTLVSQGVGGVLGNGQSARGSFSPDGTKYAFDASATNLVAGDGNAATDVFVKDLVTGSLTRVSTTSTGAEAVNGGSFVPQFSPDGTKIVFQSAATNLVTGDANGQQDIFVKDLVTGQVTRVNTTATGGEATGGGSFVPFFSPDGTKVVFESNASNLVAGDTNGGADIFIKDLVTGAVTRLSASTSGAVETGPTGAGAFAPRFSADGTLVVFESNYNNLVAGDTNNANDIFVKNLVTGALTRVSVSTTGVEGNGNSYRPVFLADGSVVYLSVASNLVSGDTNGLPDVFVTGGGVPGADFLYGGDGNDTLYGEEGNDNLFGEADNDLLDGGVGNDGLSGGAGNDDLYGGDGDDGLFGGDGDDDMYGEAGGDYMLGGAGADYMFGGDGQDLLGGEAGDDGLRGGAGNDTLYGGAGQDGLFGEDGDDVMDGGDDGDYMLGGAGADRMSGGAGADLLGGEDGNDQLFGGTGADSLYGGAGADVMFGEDGADLMVGGDGDDVIGGGAGVDSLFGGAGADRFLFYTGDSVLGAADRIFDFQSGVDKIDLSLMDANTTVAGQQAFTYVGYSAAPTGAGTLRLGFVQDVGIFLFGYTDGDGVADFIVNVGTFNVTRNDLRLTLADAGLADDDLIVEPDAPGDAVISWCDAFDAPGSGNGSAGDELPADLMLGGDFRPATPWQPAMPWQFDWIA